MHRLNSHTECHLTSSSVLGNRGETAGHRDHSLDTAVCLQRGATALGADTSDSSLPPLLGTCCVTLHRSCHLSDLVSGVKWQLCRILLRITETFYESVIAYYTSPSNLTVSIKLIPTRTQFCVLTHLILQKGKDKQPNQNNTKAQRGYEIQLRQHS